MKKAIQTFGGIMSNDRNMSIGGDVEGGIFVAGDNNTIIQQDKFVKPNDKELANLKDSIVKIHCYDEKDALVDGGTGFFVAKNLILTCFHCIHDKNNQKYEMIMISNGKPDSPEITAEFIESFSSRDYDYAALYVNKPIASVIQLLNETESYKKDDPIYSYGFNKPDKNKISNKIEIEGFFLNRRESPQQKHLEELICSVKEGIQCGQSGSPVCIFTENDRKFKVIGICTRQPDKSDKMYASPIEFFTKYIREQQPTIQMVDVTSCSLDGDVDLPYQISRQAITYKNYNELFNTNQEGINYYDALKYAHCLDFDLATEIEWHCAVRANKLVISKYKEWLYDNSEQIKLINQERIGNIDKVCVRGERPEKRSENFGFRVVSRNIGGNEK